MEKIVMLKQRDSILDTIFLNISYMSGDSDFYDDEEVSFGEHIKFSNYTEYLEEIESVIENYRILSKLTDCNDELYKGMNKNGFDDTIEYIKENYSEELSILFDDIPEDRTYYDRKAYLCCINLCAYNNKGEYFKSKDLI